MRYVWNTVIDDVVHRDVTVCGRKSTNGDAILTMEDAGWYIRLGNLLIHVGSDQPPFGKGDKVKMSLEKLECLANPISVSADPKLVNE